MSNHKPTFSPSNFTHSKGNILYNTQGIDTIQLIGKHEVVKKFCERLGLNLTAPKKHSPLTNKVKAFETIAQKDTATRYKQELFTPTIEVAKLGKGKALSNYMTITCNTPLLFDYATHHKKAKGTYCIVEFTGLHQPTGDIQKEAMQIMSKFLKRKAFSVYSIDIATDTKDPKLINYRRKKEHHTDVKQLKDLGIVSHVSSLYINKPKSDHIGRILYYDKYKKQTKHHKQRIAPNLKEWKRLEVTLTMDIFKAKKRNSFIDYINGLDFMDAMAEVQQTIKSYNIRAYDDIYLLYQLNTWVDNRIMNNKATKKRYNSKESIERFKQSDFRRYTLAI